MSAAVSLPADPEESAHSAGLRYLGDDAPGITRRRTGKHFRYVDAHGRVVRDEAVLRRIRALAIPPAWEKVWISTAANGHLQATGRDVKGRKQYRYHPRWREVRDETKYHRMLSFAGVLPRVRARIDEDLKRPGLPQEKVVATVVSLLEATLIRVGNEEYARDNHSYGLTTLEDRHVEVTGATLRFRFRGKSGVPHDVDLRDRRLAAIVRKCQELPGHELFHYVDDSGATKPIESGHVNAWLHEVAGEEFTAKDFRTWAGTVHAALDLAELAPAGSSTEAKRNVAAAIKRVASRLRNTPTVCRKCYIHPAIVAGYMEGELAEALKKGSSSVHAPHALRPEERAVIAFLTTRAAKDAEPLEAKLVRSIARVAKRAPVRSVRRRAAS